MHCEEEVINYVVLGVEGGSHSGIFWDTTLCRWASSSRRFGRSLYLHVNEKGAQNEKIVYSCYENQ
jgi:hypothetical protein